MKKFIALMAVVFVLALCVSLGPADNSGDGLPDGSGWGVDDLPSQGTGPAPNSGDGIPDGSGF